MSNKKTWSPQDKMQIVMEFFNTNISQAELYRKHNLSPTTLQLWRQKFVQGGRQALAGGSDEARQQRALQKENESYKKLIGELAISNDILKKTLESGKR